MRLKKRLPLLLLAALLCALSGCSPAPQTVRSALFAMDTVMDLQLCGNGGTTALQACLDRCTEEIYSLERQLSATNPDSFISAVNQADGAWVEVSDPALLDLLERTAALCRQTDGALDLTAYPAVKAWGFPTGEYRVPSAEELAALAARIAYSALEIDRANGRVRIPSGMELDLGAAAKGCAADRLRVILEEGSVQSALLDLGQSTILALGSRPDGTPWRIGVKDPAQEGYMGVLALTDRCVGTSGGYQRFFERDGVTYWHILDPNTAAPARSGLASVTVVGTDGLVCDGLSTALFVLGLEQGTRLWRDRASLGLEFDVVFLSEDGSVAVTEGLKDSFTLASGYEDREVTILR